MFCNRCFPRHRGALNCASEKVNPRFADALNDYAYFLCYVRPAPRAPPTCQSASSILALAECRISCILD